MHTLKAHSGKFSIEVNFLFIYLIYLMQTSTEIVLQLIISYKILTKIKTKLPGQQG
jgi:hypothetical protein